MLLWRRSFVPWEGSPVFATTSKTDRGYRIMMNICQRTPMHFVLVALWLIKFWCSRILVFMTCRKSLKGTLACVRASMILALSSPFIHESATQDMAGVRMKPITGALQESLWSGNSANGDMLALVEHNKSMEHCHILVVIQRSERIWRCQQRRSERRCYRHARHNASSVVTKHGRSGFGPRQVEEADTSALLFGCKVLCVFR